jgi:hypothetical protein
MIITIIEAPLVGVINDLDKEIINKRELEELKKDTYKDNAPTGDPLVEEIFYNTDLTPEENMKNNLDILTKNKNDFEALVPRIRRISNDGVSFMERGMWPEFEIATIYDDLGKDQYGYNSRRMFCEFYDGERYPYYDEYRKVKHEGKEYFVFAYHNRVAKDQSQWIPVDFVANDVEDIFGELENRKDFEEKVEECFEFCRKSKGVKEFSFATKTGSIISIEASYAMVDIYGEYAVEIVNQ